jgi:hypothetical protein
MVLYYMLCSGNKPVMSEKDSHVLQYNHDLGLYTVKLQLKAQSQMATCPFK